MAEPKPKLEAVKEQASEAPAAGRATPARAAEASKRSRGRLWLLLLAFLVATASVFVQSQRLAESQAVASALSEQVTGLQAQLAAAHTQIATYELQRSQVREAVSDLWDRVLLLGELVGRDSPLGEPTPAP
jgi:hypothetical protein